MNSSFPPDVQAFVADSVASGEYQSEDDVVVDAVRALRELKRRHSTLRQDVQQAIAEMDAGLGEPWDAGVLKDELSRQLDSSRE